MKRVVIITLGILNIVAFISTLFIICIPYLWWGFDMDYILSRNLPFIIIAAYTLTIGICTLKRKNWIWSIFSILGLILAGAAWFYFF